MKKIFFTPGPSQLYPTFRDHLMVALERNIGSISHRSGAFQELFAATQSSLRRLLSIPDNMHIFFLSSSLESMERIIENCVEKYSFHLVNGSFSKKFQTIAMDLGMYTDRNISKDGHGFHSDHISVPVKSELIAITQNETSTGVQIPVSCINELRSRYPKPLIAVDLVSSAPYPTIDFSKIDLAFFSVQKGFGMPAGMSILIANDRAIDRARFLKKKKNIGSFHSFTELLDKEEQHQTPETPNVLFLYILQKICEDMLMYGVQNIRHDIETNAKMIYSFFEKCTCCYPFVSENEFRSPTTITIVTGEHTKRIVEKYKKRDIIVGGGYGEYKNSQIRIANFPAISQSDVGLLLKSFDK